MVITKIFDPLRVALICIAIFSLFLGASLYIYRGIKKERKNERYLLFGMACFLIFSLAIVKLFQFLADTEIYGYYSGHDYYGDFYIHSTLYEIYGKMAIIFPQIGFSLFFLSFEMSVKRTKYVLSMIALINTIITIIISLTCPIQANYDFEKFSTTFNVFTFYFILIWLTRNASTELKSVSAAMVMGYFLLIIGFSSLDGIPVKEATSSTLHLGPLLVIFGSFVFISPLLLDVSDISQIKKIWMIISIMTTIIGFMTIIFYLVFGIFELLAYSILYLVFWVIGIIIVFKGFDSERLSEGAKQMNMMELFSRPKRLTEEEVSISKEKKTCIVCKGAILGINFLCTNCGAFYCKKCYTALADLENACWACDTILDDSKPQKLQKKETIKPIIDDEKHKKKN